MALWVWRFVEGDPPTFFMPPAFIGSEGVTKNKTTRLCRKNNSVGT